MAEIRSVIQKIRTRAPMYVGQRSISCLRAFLNGWEFAHDGRVDDASLMESLQEWAAHKSSVPAAQSWDRIILFDSQDEADAFDKFFTWFDEFIAAREKGHAEAPKAPRPAGASRKRA